MLVYYYRDLGIIFAAGNLPETHDLFEMEHSCNMFCTFFHLPTDYDNWGLTTVHQALPRSGSRSSSVNRHSALDPNGSKAMSLSCVD
jgi:hypothetical protein